MPSTYSPLLRLELIGAGEQSGLWGDTTNKNLGTLLEQAVAGVATIPVLAPGVKIVEALDGTQDQARSAVLYFTGAPGGAVTAQIPSTTKLYVVRNGTNVTLTVKTAAQVSNPLLGGVELLPDDATLVFCDGSSAIKGIQTAGVGTLTVAGGGTGRFTFPVAGFLKTPGGAAAFTSSAAVNLATEVTGVLPPANGGTGGTLPVANGGTGTTTAPSAGQVLIGTSSAGYVPGFLTQGTGITITPTSGGITIAASGTAGGVTSVSGSGNISVSPTTGNPVVSITNSPTFSSYVTTPTLYLGGSPGANYIQSLPSNEIGVITGSLQATKFTVNGIGTNSLQAAGVIQSIGAGSAGDQRITISGAGYGSGMAPAAYQCGAAAYGLTYTPSPQRLDILGGSLSAYFTGSVGFQGNNSPNWAVASDQNLKTNLRPINSALAKLNALKPCHFEYKDALGTTRTGFIAQEFETVFPGHVSELGVADNYKEFVPEGQETIKVLDPNLLPYLVKAVQELSAKVDSQAEKITALEEQVLNLSVK